MSSNPSSGSQPVPFPTTHWSIIAGGTARLDELFRIYEPAMRTYCMRVRRLSAEEAEEVTQGFVAEVLVGRRLAERARATRGRFRALLVRALDRYLVSRLRHRTADKRHPSQGSLVSLDALGEVPSPAPADVFDAAWARELLHSTLDQMKAHCQATDQINVWRVFEQRVVIPSLEGGQPLPYADMVARFGLTNPTVAANLLITGKRMFDRMLRAAVLAYVGEEGLVAEELRDLAEILARIGAGTTVPMRSKGRDASERA